MRYSQLLKVYTLDLISRGYRGFEYIFESNVPKTARRGLCQLDSGNVVHYDICAYTQSERLRYNNLELWKPLGRGKKYLGDEVGWFYVRK